MKTLAVAFAALFAAATPPASPPAKAQSARAVAAPAQVPASERSAVLAAASRALNETTGLTGRFLQLNASGSTSGGVFHLSRPGRLRFEYDAPNPLLVVADGSTVAISDRSLRTVDRVPLRATPLHFVLKRDINLERDARITSVTREGGLLNVTARDREGQTDGQIILTFDAASYELRQWRVIDGQGQATTLTLQNPRAASRFDPKLFVVQDAKDPTARRPAR
jgi:outer membrane lipoprotein-sorting protein